ncbi:DEAD/DEAH box helicase [Azospirillum sp. RWY-5-1]|uniref:DEAD/DEAH box helicase n=1 Tax=Azospirillum oleiclasticum TaxID=2735135 RepID=A0ABX2TH08_9PROT|nr:DEAD/DEAH box helicase [Azospirillum oleiclasticum]NYZ15985.1 DEAD/DEAH box helicase [Azospirillum oleiclasticum]NYZ23536.1 DEAD/DEAH box helicase [Azospirillum oleiclasticum]
MTFSELNLHTGLLRALEAAGHTSPTPVQAAAIPAALEGRDVLATADTGTGKTGAFLLPSLHRLAVADEERKTARPFGPRVLVLAPTRELARQVTMAARTYVKFLRLFIVDVVGGEPFRPQIRDLSRTVDVLVATPGRLMDHIRRGNVRLDEVEVLILDEADRMLDMGFAEDIAAISGACPKERQTLLFTATLDRRMEGVARNLVRDPARVAVESTPASAPKIEQRVMHADDLGHKRKLLRHFAASTEIHKAIIFAATKRDADELASELAQEGHAAAALHGDMHQEARTRTLHRLRDGRVRLLVATDVAARGIDVRDISHVINFDLPRNPEDYVHRIGRTGRAGAEGIAISFATRNDRGSLRNIERLIGNSVTVHTVEGLEPTMSFDPPRGAHQGRPRGRGGFGGGPRGAQQPARRPHRNGEAPRAPRPAQAGDGGFKPMSRRHP